MDDVQPDQVATPTRRTTSIGRLLRRRRRSVADVGDGSGNSRRAFLRHSGGMATGVAAFVGVPTALLNAEADADAAVAPAKVVANPTGTPPDGPVMAYVQDAKKGTVVIMSGLTERTVEDHELVRRLLVVPTKPKPARKLKPVRKPKTSKKGR